MRKTIATCAAVSLLGPSAAASAEDVLARGATADGRGNVAQVLLPLRTAALAGHAWAQEMLGFIHAPGGTAHPGIDRDRQAAVYWFDMAARNGREVSRYMSCKLRNQAAASPAPACLEAPARVAESPQ